MKGHHKLHLLFILGALFCGWMVSKASAGVETNGTFEAWSGSPLQADGWSTFTEATYEQASVAHTGSYSAKVTPTATYQGIRQLNIAANAETTYKLTVWMRGAGTGGNDAVRIMAYTYTDDYHFFITDTAAQGGLSDSVWTQYTLTFVTPADTTWLELQFGAYQDPASNPISFYIDDVSLDESVSLTGSPLNGNFEVWSGSPALADAWSSKDSATYEQSTVAHDGSYAAKVTPTGTYAGIQQQNITIKAETTYVLTLWMRGAGTGGDDAVRIMAYTATDTNYFFITDTAAQGGLPDSEWKQYSLVFTTPADATWLELQFGAYQDPASNPISFYVDGVSLDESVDLIGSPLNGGFEVWSGIPLQADAWSPKDAATYEQSATAHGGSYSALVTPTGTYAGIQQQSLTVKPNTSYQLTAWIRGGGTGGDDAVRLMAYTGGSNFFTSDTAGQGGLSDDEWRQFTLDFTTPEDATMLELQFGAYQDPASNPISFYIDDVVLSDLTPPNATQHWTCY